MWFILMTAVKQVLIAVSSSVIVTACLGYGSVSYWGGSLETRILSIESFDLKQMKTDIALNKQVNENQDDRADTFESMILQDRKEQREENAEQRMLANQQLDQLRIISSTQSEQGAKIGGLEINMKDLRDNVREIRSNQK